MTGDDDDLYLLSDEIKSVFHVVSKKIGELGIIYLPLSEKKYMFRQTDLSKYLKGWHLAFILHELNKLNDSLSLNNRCINVFTNG